MAKQMNQNHSDIIEVIDALTDPEEGHFPSVREVLVELPDWHYDYNSSELSKMLKFALQGSDYKFLRLRLHGKVRQVTTFIVPKGMTIDI